MQPRAPRKEAVMAKASKKQAPAEQNRPPPDEVDASKGIFPFGTKHPEGAELRNPGSFTPYEESGRSGLDTTSNPQGFQLSDEIKQRIEAEPPRPSRPSRPSKSESLEPKGQLPAHR
jgi:hypothetical protein